MRLKKREKLWTLGLILQTVQHLNAEDGSTIRDIILDMVKGTRGQTNAAVFDAQCKKFETAFKYGVLLDVLVPADAKCKRYKIGISAPDVSKFLQSVDKSAQPKPVEKKESKPKPISMEIDSDEDDEDYDRFKTGEIKCENRSVTDLKVVTESESSDESCCSCDSSCDCSCDCEII